MSILGTKSDRGVKISKLLQRPLLLLSPSLVGVILFYLLPFVEVVRRSFTDAMGRRFVGLANYQAVWQNNAFRIATANTVKFVGICIPLLLGTSLALALLIRAAGAKE